MPDWTKTNFGDLRDLRPEDARVQWRFAREALGSPELGVSRFTYDPGGRMPWGHRHRVQEEIYVVVAGSGRAKLDGRLRALPGFLGLTAAPVRRLPDQRRDFDSFRLTAARMRPFRASSSISSPSRKSIARRVFPSRLELNRPEGSSRDAPLAKVIFTTCL